MSLCALTSEALIQCELTRQGHSTHRLRRSGLVETVRVQLSQQRLGAEGQGPSPLQQAGCRRVISRNGKTAKESSVWQDDRRHCRDDHPGASTRLCTGTQESPGRRRGPSGIRPAEREVRTQQAARCCADPRVTVHEQARGRSPERFAVGCAHCCGEAPGSLLHQDQGVVPRLQERGRNEREKHGGALDSRRVWGCGKHHEARKSHSFSSQGRWQTMSWGPFPAPASFRSQARRPRRRLTAPPLRMPPPRGPPPLPLAVASPKLA